uniref:Uncharacterized protein n=1 Tax=Oryza brachyantha TaxID=4533 RepID=J3MLT8_ORYBR
MQSASLDALLLGSSSSSRQLVLEVGSDEGVQLAVHDAGDVRRLAAGADVLDELVGVEDVVADLLPPLRLHRVAADLLDLRRALLLGDHQQLRLQPAQGLYLVGQLAPFLCEVLGNGKMEKNMTHAAPVLDANAFQWHSQVHI